MKKFFKWAAILLLVLILAVTVLLAYVKTALPNVGPPPEILVSNKPAEVARGEYLANHVMACVDCHSTRRLPDLFSMPHDSSTFCQGGQLFDQRVGLPGAYYSSNITPAGIATWTDGEIYRAISTGVRKSGKPIFPIMPYLSYGYATPADVMAVVAYLRTIPSKVNAVPESHSDFPMNFILNTIPKRATPLPTPDANDSLAQGKYLTMIAACVDCHTPFEKGQQVKGMEYAGGREFMLPGGIVRSANITSDSRTGIGAWTKTGFIQRFAQYRDSAAAHRRIAPGEMQSAMPWTLYAGMTDRDLGNIYVYLRTIAPNVHEVKHFDAARPALNQ